MSEFKNSIFKGIPESLPDFKKRSKNISHAPNRKDSLTTNEKALALKNALRYFPKTLHSILGPEFKEELDVTIRLDRLLHTTTNFIQSAFKKDEQPFGENALGTGRSLGREAVSKFT